MNCVQVCESNLFKCNAKQLHSIRALTGQGMHTQTTRVLCPKSDLGNEMVHIQHESSCKASKLCSQETKYNAVLQKNSLCFELGQTAICGSTQHVSFIQVIIIHTHAWNKRSACDAQRVLWSRMVHICVKYSIAVHTLFLRTEFGLSLHATLKAQEHSELMTLPSPLIHPCCPLITHDCESLWQQLPKYKYTTHSCMYASFTSCRHT